MAKNPEATQDDPLVEATKPVSSYNEGTAADIRYNLKRAVKVVVDLNDTLSRADPIAKAVDALITLEMDKAPEPTGPENDPCAKPTPTVAPFCSALSLSKATSELTYKQAVNTAAGALYTAVNTWDVALVTYDNAIQDANATLDGSVTTAHTTYLNSLKAKPDAVSRAQYLWWVLKGSIVAAVNAYETGVQGAANNLAAAAGTLLGAYTEFVSAINLAAAARAASDCTAQQTFWQSVETARDH